MSSEGNQAVDQPPQRAARSKAHETLTKLSKLDLLKMLKSLRAQLAQKSEVLALTTENLCEQASIQDELKKEIRHLQEQLQSRRHEDSEAKDDEIQRLKVRLDASQRLAQKRATEVEELREKLRVLRPKLQQQQRQLSEARNDASVALERLKTAHEAQVQAQETASKSQRELRQLESAVAARVAAEQRRLQEIRTQLQHQVAASTQQHEADTARWRDTERDLRSRVQQLEQENAQLREDIESGAAEDRRFNKLCEVQARLGGALFDRSEREARVAELEMRCRQLLLRDKAHRRRTKRLQAQLELLQGGKDADSGGSSSSDDTGVVGGTPSDLRYVRNVFVKFLQLTPLSPPQQQLLPLYHDFTFPCPCLPWSLFASGWPRCCTSMTTTAMLSPMLGEDTVPNAPRPRRVASWRRRCHFSPAAPLSAPTTSSSHLLNRQRLRPLCCRNRPPRIWKLRATRCGGGGNSAIVSLSQKTTAMPIESLPKIWFRYLPS
ncbi:MAG: hypothetical protein MHM6MM_001986 [Cercozoa sp. M6MM]